MRYLLYWNWTSTWGYRRYNPETDTWNFGFAAGARRTHVEVLMRGFGLRDWPFQRPGSLSFKSLPDHGGLAFRATQEGRHVFIELVPAQETGSLAVLGLHVTSGNAARQPGVPVITEGRILYEEHPGMKYFVTSHSNGGEGVLFLASLTP